MIAWEWLYARGQVELAVVAFLLYLGSAGWVTVHALLTREEHRSTTGWVALAWLSPFLGAVAYLMLGINRVRRRAARLAEEAMPRTVPPEAAVDPDTLDRWQGLVRTADSLSDAPLLPGNRIEPLYDGDETYPAMLEAIEGAEHSVAMLTFLFDRGVWGERLLDALVRAHDRGVQVRFLMDGIGWLLYSHPKPLGRLKRAGVPAARFLWGLPRTGLSWINLRNHRKILVVDGRLGFTGGMNVRDAYDSGLVEGEHADHDLHARVRGPVVRELMVAFAADWRFTTGEALSGGMWFPPLQAVGTTPSRVYLDGPDRHLDHARLIFHAAVSEARERLLVVTPYFLPEQPLQTALALAARRGVEVDVLLSLPTNQPLADAATRADLSAVLRHGVRVWSCSEGFDHSKLVVVDHTWVCLGSANWDPRSLRLNFELQVEAYDPQLAAGLEAHFDARLAAAERITLEGLRSRGGLRRVVDGAVRLFKPYL